MASSSSSAISHFPSVLYKPKYDTWPYSAQDFERSDETPDAQFYSEARLFTHIDDAAIARLKQYYETVLPRTGKILDLCTSWNSYYPTAVKKAV